MIAVYIAICLVCFLGVSAYAANTGIQSSIFDRDDRSGDSSTFSPSTYTDIPEVLNNEISDLDSPIILLERGTIVMAGNLEDAPPLRASSSGDQQIGYSISVSSSIGDHLLVPSEYSEKSFSLDANGNLIGVRSSTFSCYIGQYIVRFPVYGQPQYRLTSGTSYAWQDIDIEYLSTSNVEVIGAHVNYWSDQFKVLISVATLCFVLILAFRRH